MKRFKVVFVSAITALILASCQPVSGGGGGSSSAVRLFIQQKVFHS